jgi:AmmeMemoRadiSam system protein A
MSSSERGLSTKARSTLLEVARAAIEYGFGHGCAPVVDLSLYSDELRADAASFVTLHRTGQLRGCMGTLRATRPLVEDISRNAWRSANADSRFAPLPRDELSGLEIHLSVLGPLSPLPVNSRTELLGELRPGIDGLVLRDGSATATFLPSVWEQLPTPERFFAELLHKAELERDHWSDAIELERYTVEEF